MEILGDFQTTVRKALTEIDPKWQEYDGLIICGSHTPKDVEHILSRIRNYRENRLPILGICYGHQLCAIEYARNVLGITYAMSEEFGMGTFIVKKRPALKVGWHEGETWWSYYDVDPKFLKDWKKPDNMITAPFHPEYQSSYWKPHPLLVEFIEICKK